MPKNALMAQNKIKGDAYANDNANAKLVDSDLGDEHGTHGIHGKG